MNALIIAYYVLAGLSVLCSIFVILTLAFYGSLKTSATRLLMALHFTLIWEEVTALPYVYNTNNALCEAVAFLHYYFGLASIVAIGFLVISYRYHFFLDHLGVNKFIQSWSITIVAVFPMITFLPFITNTYRAHDGPWCAIGGERDDHSWTFAIFYVWVWLILFFSAAWLIITMAQIYKVDRASGHRLFSTVGMYSVISIATWIPRTVVQIANFSDGTLESNEWEYSYFPLYVAGILYTLVFLTEKKALILFDRALNMDNRDMEERTHSSFSWEGSDFRFTNSEHTDGSHGSHGSHGSSRGSGRMVSMTERTTTRSMTQSPFVLTSDPPAATVNSHNMI
jgi:hypothetical protein